MSTKLPFPTPHLDQMLKIDGGEPCPCVDCRARYASALAMDLADPNWTDGNGKPVPPDQQAVYAIIHGATIGMMLQTGASDDEVVEGLAIMSRSALEHFRAKAAAVAARGKATVH